jgi:DNA-binding response OmpR family regulator
MSRKRILIVDDSPSSILWQRTILGHAGFEIITATNGREGVEAALAQRPDLVMMDTAMPEMDGFEACRALRADDATARVPIIMATTRGSTQDVTESRRCGANDHIAKPIDKTDLLAKVRRLLPQPQQQQQSAKSPARAGRSAA